MLMVCEDTNLTIEREFKMDSKTWIDRGNRGSMISGVVRRGKAVAKIRTKRHKFTKAGRMNNVKRK